MDVMQLRRNLLMIFMGDASDMELIKTYTVPESWENNTDGNPQAISNALFTSDELSAFGVDDYIVEVVENNTATSYNGIWILFTPANVGYGFCLRNTNQVRNLNSAISFWVSSGATIKAYKGNLASLYS